jgi:flagellar M-ring protein FliF
MNETLHRYIEPLKQFWNKKSTRQKWLITGISLLAIILISVTVYILSRPTMVPLYSNLSPAETGSIKESLDAKGIPSEITDGGTTIKVPDQYVDTLLVELAAEGIPKSGSIDYSFFSQNAGFGMTENEFNVMKLDAMQTELAELIKGIDGVRDARVMINLPNEGVFVKDKAQEASASIVLQTEPGYDFDEKQIKSLYHLVSKSIPNLPTDNIVIMNQYFEYFDLKDDKNSTGSLFAEQQNIKEQIERNIQRQVQSMLGTLMGHDKVVVSVTADVDFTQENREESLVTPVDEENMEGITISAQRITETFTGNADAAGGVPQGEDPTDSLGTSYLEGNGGTGDYERMEETINKEVNRIRKEIVESPYKIRDLGIQVMVEPPNPEDPSSLPEDRREDITKMLATIVRTSIDKEVATPLTDEEIEDRIVVSVQPFKGKIEFNPTSTTIIPWWAYVVGGVLIGIICLLIFLLMRARRRQDEEDMVLQEMSASIEIPDVNEEVETEASMRRKQLEKMAKEKPEEFAKILRTWLAED